jgi:hypothetical protein
MQAREWTFVDKSTWGEGSWQQEPDKKQWQDEMTGLPCLIVRGPSGGLCGYVGVAPGHAWYGKRHSECLECHEEDEHGTCIWDGHRIDDRLRVHGGITFSEFCIEDPEQKEQGICHIVEPGEFDKVWWFGFDCAHSGDQTPGSDAKIRDVLLARGTYLNNDYATYRDIAYVEQEVQSLAKQLSEVQ